MDHPRDLPELDTGDFVGSAEIDRDLTDRYPRLPRLVDAVGRRKRLLRALAAWRGPRESQDTVGQRIGSTQPSIARLESGRVDPKLSMLERYAAAMDANFIWQIVDDEGTPVSDEFRWQADVSHRQAYPGLDSSSVGIAPGGVKRAVVASASANRLDSAFPTAPIDLGPKTLKVPNFEVTTHSWSVDSEPSEADSEAFSQEEARELLAV